MAISVCACMRDESIRVESCCIELPLPALLLLISQSHCSRCRRTCRDSRTRHNKLRVARHSFSLILTRNNYSKSEIVFLLHRCTMCLLRTYYCLAISVAITERAASTPATGLCVCVRVCVCMCMSLMKLTPPQKKKI